MNITCRITLLVCLVSAFWFSPARAVLLNFEDMDDLTSVGDSYAVQGVHFSNAVSLTAGFSLNEYDYPPSSGLMAIGDDQGPIGILFDQDVENVFANFTYGSQLLFSAYDASNGLIGTFTNAGMGNLGSTERISLSFTGIRSLTIAGAVTGSFIMDDFNFDPVPAVPVPEPSGILLLAASLGFLGFFNKGFGPGRRL